jgi:hypothetical protein
MEDIIHDAVYSDLEGNVKDGCEWVEEYQAIKTYLSWEDWGGDDLIEVTLKNNQWMPI